MRCAIGIGIIREKVWVGPGNRVAKYNLALKLLETCKREKLSVSALAARLKRDAKSVRRDVSKLEKVGVVRTRLEANPGHGSVRIVEPVARTIALRASFRTKGER